MLIGDGGVTTVRVGENAKKGKSRKEGRVQGIKNRRVKQDLDRWLLCELRGIGVDFADREESIFLLEPFTRTPRFRKSGEYERALGNRSQHSQINGSPVWCDTLPARRARCNC